MSKVLAARATGRAALLLVKRDHDRTPYIVCTVSDLTLGDRTWIRALFFWTEEQARETFNGL